ncbi:CaiB/BaiF CoA transferase family protein [Chelatococcus reniformis]|uniref:CoA transferase n=1 Tax=Chelatococcus reniformis TaxID=1494448 RepID=A0A916USJ2_9HYPH|nr:CoA transferase [Chelatococcus reniformis]GGC84877.1 CoA transferase [Chelatococcus reniformis]
MADAAQEPSQQQNVFSGLRVIDAGSFVAVPAAATILADFGADVIKVEPPGSGDPMRTFHLTPGLPPSEEAYYWTLLARNKRSVALDLKAEDDRVLLRRLVATADVFITNMPLKVRDRLGIAYGDLAHLNDRLIYASFTGYGETGPEKDVAAFDATAWWARSGLMDQVRGGDASPPARSTPGMGDHMASLALFGAIAAALYRRAITGKGAHVGSSLIANGAWSNAVSIQQAAAGVPIAYPPPRDLATNPLGNHYLCADGRWLSIAMTPPQQASGWPALAQAVGLGHLVEDPRYRSSDARTQNASALIDLLDEAFAARTSIDWRAILVPLGVSLSVVAKAGDAVGDEQMRVAGVVTAMPAAKGGLTISSPFWFADQPKRPAGPPPGLGEHTREILDNLSKNER